MAFPHHLLCKHRWLQAYLKDEPPTPIMKHPPPAAPKAQQSVITIPDDEEPVKETKKKMPQLKMLLQTKPTRFHKKTHPSNSPSLQPAAPKTQQPVITILDDDEEMVKQKNISVPPSPHQHRLLTTTTASKSPRLQQDASISQQPVITILDDDEEVLPSTAFNLLDTLISSFFTPNKDKPSPEFSDLDITGEGMLQEWIDISELNVKEQTPSNTQIEERKQEFLKQEEPKENEASALPHSGGAVEDHNWADLNVEEDPDEEPEPIVGNYKDAYTPYVSNRISKQSCEESKWVHCPHCLYKGKTQEDLKMHKRQAHMEFYSPRINKSCDLRFKGKRALDVNKMARHSPADVKKLKCEHCDFETDFKYNLTSHIFVKHIDVEKSRWYKCDGCDFRTKTKKKLTVHKFEAKHEKCLRRHVGSNHPNSSSSKEVEMAIEGNLANEELKCQKCGFKFSGQREFRTHLRWNGTTLICDGDKLLVNTAEK